MERLELRSYDFLSSRYVVRPLPDCETLELADPGEALEADSVSAMGLEDPSSPLSAVTSFLVTWGGDAWHPLLLIPRSEMRVHSDTPFELRRADPRLLYALLHGVGCRLHAILFFGAKPRGEEERALFERAVADLSEQRRGKPWPRRVVFLQAVPGEDLLKDLDEETKRSDPLVRASFRFSVERRILRQAAEIAAAASALNPMRVFDGDAVWIRNPRHCFYFSRVSRKVLERWVRDTEAAREFAREHGLPFGEYGPAGFQVGAEAAYRAMRALEEAVLARAGSRRGPPPEHLLPLLCNLSKCYAVLVDCYDSVFI